MEKSIALESHGSEFDSVSVTHQSFELMHHIRSQFPACAQSENNNNSFKKD